MLFALAPSGPLNVQIKLSALLEQEVKVISCPTATELLSTVIHASGSFEQDATNNNDKRVIPSLLLMREFCLKLEKK